MFNYDEVVFHWVNRLGFLSRSELSAKFSEAGHHVSTEEWAILLVLWSKGPQVPSDLADVTFKDRTTVTRLIDTMVSKEFVSRTEDPADRRRSIIDVTPHGAKLKSRLFPIAQKFISGAVADIPPEDIETTTRTLRAITENLFEKSTKAKKRN